MPFLSKSEPVAVEFRDGSKGTVDVSELSVRKLYHFCEHLSKTDPSAIVSLCCDKPDQWIDTLTLESFNALSQKAFDLNFQNAVRLAGSNPIVAAKISGALLLLEGAKESFLAAGGVLKLWLPEPASSASAEETPSASSTLPSPVSPT